MRALGIVGCGQMGSELTAAAACAGLDVIVVKATAGALGDAVAKVDAALDRGVARRELTAAARVAARTRVTFSADLDALAPCDLVVECTAETSASKKRMLAEIEQVIRREAVLATSTASLPLAQLARSLVRPERFLGLHFFAPVSAVKLVEVGRTHDTAEGALSVARAFCASLGKTPITLGDQPGYVVNRLLVPYLLQAIEMLDEGSARAVDIDSTMTMGCGQPLGPLALADQMGLDVLFAMAQTLSNELHDRRYKPPALLLRLVLSGHLGKKSKLGLYDYRRGEPRENEAIRVARTAGSDLTATAE